MFSPKRSSDRKVDKKAIKEKYRQKSESRDNNIKLNILGIPKEQVSVHKTHRDSKNEDLFKIYIDTHNKRRNKSTSSDTSDSNAGNENTVPPKKDRRDNDVCLNLPGQKKRDVKIMQRPSEATIRDSPNQQFMQYNTQPESAQNKLFQQSKEPASNQKTDRNQVLSPTGDDKQVSGKSVKKSKPGQSGVGKQVSKQVGFSDYDAVYGTGSEESSDDTLPFDKKSPMVYRVGNDMPQGAFGQLVLKDDPTMADPGKRGTAQPVGINNTALEPSKRIADQEVPLQQSVPTELNKDGKMAPSSDEVPKEHPSLKDKIDNSSLNAIGVPNLETQPKNVSKRMTADSETMTDSTSPINKGNIPNVGSGASKKFPLSRDPSSESSGRYRSPDGSKSRKNLVSTIPKPDFNALRREKGPQSPVGQEKGTQPTKGQEKSPQSIQGQEKGPQSPIGQEKGPQPTQGQEKDPQSTQGQEKGPQSAQGQENGPQSTQGKEKAPQSSQGQEKGPQSSQDQGKGPGLMSKTTIAGKDNVDGPGDELVNSAAPKPHRKLTPVNINKRNLKPIFFPPETNYLGEQYTPPPQRPGNLSHGQLEREGSEVDPIEKQFHIDADKNKSGGNSQTKDDTRAPQSKAGNDRSRSVSIVLTGSRINELEPVKRSINHENIAYSPSLDGYVDLADQSPPYRVPAREQAKHAVPVDEHVDKDTAKRRYNSPSPSLLSKLFYPFKESPSPKGKISESSNKSSGSKIDDDYADSVGTSEEIASNTYPSNVASVDMRNKQSSAFPINQKPSSTIQQLGDLLNDGALLPDSQKELAYSQGEKSSSTIKPTLKPSLHDITHSNEEKGKTNTENDQSDSVVSQINPKDYLNLNSTGAIPRTTRSARSVNPNQGPSKSGQSWPNVGEKLSKRGTPSVGTIKEEGTDPETETLSPGLRDGRNRPSEESRLTLDISGAQYEPGEDSNNIDKDRTNILAYPGHLADGTPFAYSPTGPDAYPLESTPSDYSGDNRRNRENVHSHYPGDNRHNPENIHSDHLGGDPRNPVDEPQFHASTDDREDAPSGRPGRKSKTVKQKTAPGRAHKRSRTTRNGVHGPENEAGAFGLGPDKKLVYLGKIPNTTYNVFYSPEDKTTPSSTESKTTVLNPKKKLVWEMPKGILIFVNKKNDHACPFKNGNRNVAAYPVDSDMTNRDDLGIPRGVGQRSRRASLDKKVTVERTPGGKNVKEEYPCGCYRVATFDKADGLQNEMFVSAGCADGSLCEVAHPELAPSPTGSYAVNVYRPAGRRSLGSDSGKRFPGIEVIAEGVVSKNKIQPRPPKEKMRGAGLFASLDVKSERMHGVFNFYLDPKLKRYLRENLPAMLEEDRTRRRESY